MKLNQIKPKEGSVFKRTRVGRGIGSGKGKTCGAGVKGQKARKGVAIKGFEGGQMPLHRRLPKRGFKNIFSNDFASLNLGRLQEAIDAKQIDAKKLIDEEALLGAGVVSKSRDGVRLLGGGVLKAKVEIKVTGASKSALAAVEKAGGKVEILPAAPKPEGKKAKWDKSKK